MGLAERSDKPLRITEVDVLRGFALFGITLVNTVGITGMPTSGSAGGLGSWVYETLLHQRFLPIFSFLFGLSFGLFLDAARERTRSPRLVMLARLGFLMPFGALHRLLQPREVLLTYAVVGIVVLLPASFLPGRRVILALGGVATALAAPTAGGSMLIPGLFLVGFGAARYGVEKPLSLPTSRIGVIVGITAALAVALNVHQVGTEADPSSWSATVAGLATAATYVAAVPLLMRSRLQRALCALAPVGRLALTGYVVATPLILAADHVLHIGTETNYAMALSVGAAVFAIETAFSLLWLRRARYGPLEWLWRCLTWWTVVPNSSRRG
ncbi:DUF418 domain-containing protein [Actinomadura sp. NAK00032]|uniref:DUF418 domain-containing protein n=1 Tax=Actinomadura sp. NAK00032 TaxID=2742128 RepID=UPI0015923F9B|nr:DUF418 domain-containing protein [Actinomadura sp. NAK00032]QKW35971.1 DUF418 domain-containing protein [Actinomadura sp. NAK00032]